VRLLRAPRGRVGQQQHEQEQQVAEDEKEAWVGKQRKDILPLVACERRKSRGLSARARGDECGSATNHYLARKK